MAHIRSRKHPAPSHLLALMAAVLPAAVGAQEAEKTLPAVTVKAEAEVPYKADYSANSKLTQPLLDTPQTVQVIKKEILQEQGATTLMEALRNTPGITMQLGENGNTSAGDSFQMRGFSTQTSTFVDGVRDLGAVTRDVFNLEQVEVVKGPAGSDIGRGSQSGYINLISKLPQTGDINSAAVSMGTDDYKRVSADLNKQLGEGVAVRLNVMSQSADAVGRNLAQNESVGFAPSIAFGLNSPTRFYLYSQHVRQDNVPDGGIPTIGMDGFYNANAQIHSGRKVNRENFYGSKADYEKVDADMITGKFEHDFGGGTKLQNLTRYGKSDMDRIMTGINTISRNGSDDPADWTLSRSRQRVDQTNEILANQTNVSTGFATGFIQHELSAGLEFMYERQKSRSFGTTAQTINGVSYTAISNPAASLYSPDASDDLGIPYATGAYTDGDTKTAAVYLFDTLKLNERWQLNGGVRYEHFTTTTNGRTAVVANGQRGANQDFYPDYVPGQLAPDGYKDSDNLFSWKVGALYKPASNGSIYAAYAKSLTPPGAGNFALSANPENQNSGMMDAQETTNMELGTKWELLDKRLNLSAAVYRTDNENQVSYDAISDTYSQEGKTRVEGIELAAVGQITNFWQVSAGVAKMRTKQLDQFSVNSSGDVSKTSGIRWSPDLTATLWTSYTLGDFTLGGGARYVSSQKRVVAFSDDTDLSKENMPKIPSYWVADLMAAYKLSKTVNLRLNVYNLFDKDYISTLNNSGDRMTLGAPRSAVLSANFQF